MTKRYINARQAAAILGCSNPTVFEWARQGRFEMIKLGEKTYRFDAESVRSYATKGESSPTLATDEELMRILDEHKKVEKERDALRKQIEAYETALQEASTVARGLERILAPAKVSV